MARTKKTIEPKLRIINAFAKSTELEQYRMPKKTGLSYRTILRTLKPLESKGFVKQVRTEPSEKGGKEKKIYGLTFKGALTYLNSIMPSLSDYMVEGSGYYSIDRANEIIINKIRPLTLDDMTTFLEDLGEKEDFPIFKQIGWLKEHYGRDVFRIVINAASLTVARNKLPDLEEIRKSMLADGEDADEVKLTIENFLWMESCSIRDIFEEEFAHQLSFLKGNGDLHNEVLHQIFDKVATKIEKNNQCTLAPIKMLIKTLK